jgi:hypothetical protein
MRFRPSLILLALLAPSPGLAQAPVPTFTHLLRGEVVFRAPLPWQTRAITQTPISDAAFLEYEEDRDTALSAAIAAYHREPGRSFRSWTDSVVARSPLSPHAIAVGDSLLSPTERSVLWRDSSSLAMDRFVQTPQAWVWVRIRMPAAPPHPSTIRARLHAIDDLLTTVRSGEQLLFPGGGLLSLVVF